MTEDAAGGNDASETLDEVQIGQLRLYFSITVLERVADDEEYAFKQLVRFMRESAKKLGRSTSVKLIAETLIGGPDDSRDDGSIEVLREFGFDRLHAIARRRQAPPPWVKHDSRLIDTFNELTLTLRRGRLVAVRSDMLDAAKIVKWANKLSSPYKPLMSEILEGTFEGNGTMLWAQGVHRRRTTKPDSKAISGTRLQDTYDATDDFSYAITAMRLNYVPAKTDAALAGSLTIAPERSHLSSKALPDFASFAAATEEALEMLEKSLSGEAPPDPTFPGYARRETDLSRVRGAFDIRVISPAELLARSAGDDYETVDSQAEFLRGAVGDVRGRPDSAVASLDILQDGSVHGQLSLNLSPGKSNFDSNVGIAKVSGSSELLHQARDVIVENDIVSVYYESGHSYSSGQLSIQNLNPPMFTGVLFESFEGFDIVSEKPRASGDIEIHRKIANADDRSLFAWIVKRFNQGWLICDDGAGEVADFLHIAENGTLSAIHAKASGTRSLDRRIAVTRFEELVSQAEKNVKMLRSDALRSALHPGRLANPACFVDGMRTPSRAEFLDQLDARVAVDQTHVYLIQPHLLKSRYDAARDALENDRPTADSRSLALLENLLHSTSRTIRNNCDELFVIGST